MIQLLYGNYSSQGDSEASGLIFVPFFEDEYALMETNLYDVGNNNLIWSALSETEIQNSDQDSIKSYIGVMVKAMAGKKLLK